MDSTALDLLVQKCLDRKDALYACDEKCLAKLIETPGYFRLSCSCSAKAFSTLFNLLKQARIEFELVAERLMVELEVGDDLKIDSDGRCNILRKVVNAVDAVLVFSQSVLIATPIKQLGSEREHSEFEHAFRDHIRHGLLLQFVVKEWFQFRDEQEARPSNESHEEKMKRHHDTMGEEGGKLQAPRLRLAILEFHRKFQIIKFCDYHSPLGTALPPMSRRLSKELRNSLRMVRKMLLDLYSKFDVAWEATVSLPYRERAIIVYNILAKNLCWCQFVYQEMFLNRTNDSYALSILDEILNLDRDNSIPIRKMASWFKRQFLVCLESRHVAPSHNLSQILFECASENSSRLSCAFVFLLCAMKTDQSLVHVLNRKVPDLRFWLYRSLSSLKPEIAEDWNSAVKLLSYLDGVSRYSPYSNDRQDCLDHDEMPYLNANIRYRDESRAEITWYAICLSLYRRRLDPELHGTVGFALPSDLIRKLRAFLFRIDEDCYGT